MAKNKAAKSTLNKKFAREGGGPVSAAASQAAEVESQRRVDSLFERAIGNRPVPTGRYIMTAIDDDPATLQHLVDELKDRAGIRRVRSIFTSLDASAADDEVGGDDDAEAIIMARMGVVVVDGDPDQMAATISFATCEDNRSPAAYCRCEPEYYCFTAASTPDERWPTVPVAQTDAETDLQYSRDYWLGYRAGINQMIDHVLAGLEADPSDTLIDDTAMPLAATDAILDSPRSTFDASASTWGLRGTGVTASSLTGAGVRMAVLDTGIHLSHPDFRNQIRGAKSFVGGTAQDRNGHGTHCAGTACGGQTPQGIRYGVATNAELFVGKVLNDRGTGREADVIRGIGWAVSQRCKVISVSIQRRVARCSDGFSSFYEAAGKDALKNGALVIAAAGNHSDRQNRRFVPVAAPANTPSIAGVAAIHSNGRVGNFSNRAFCQFGEVDFCAPGVDVLSSDILPSGYRRRNGTSMATPHVAGIAALLIQQDPGLAGIEIYNQIRALVIAATPGTEKDLGHGLVRAPM